MIDRPHILIVEARFYDGIADELVRGAEAAFVEAGATFAEALMFMDHPHYPVTATALAPSRVAAKGAAQTGSANEVTSSGSSA